MIEQWKPIPDFENFYETSNAGRVRRIAPAQRTRPGRIKKQTKSSNGYMTVRLHKGHANGKSLYVHRLVIQAFIGPCPPGLEVNHKNGDKSDNRICNLEYVTRSQNTIHSFQALGRIPINAEKHKNSKLTSEQVKEIRRLYATGTYSQEQLAQKFQVAQSLISGIVRRKRWKYI